MKKIVTRTISIIVFLLILLLIVLSYRKIEEKKTTKLNIQRLYDFCAFSIGDNQEFCTKSLQNKSVFILFMDPDCDFCQEEVKQIKERNYVLQDVSILLITIASPKNAIDFYSRYQLNQFNNIKLLLDENAKISIYYDIKTIPTIFIYDKNKELTFSHNGEIQVDAFIHYFNKY